MGRAASSSKDRYDARMLPYSSLRILFIDVEASGLGIGSWPVEVAWAWIDNTGGVQSDAILIRPDPD